MTDAERDLLLVRVETKLDAHLAEHTRQSAFTRWLYPIALGVATSYFASAGCSSTLTGTVAPTGGVSP
jgi:hypothetical protein